MKKYLAIYLGDYSDCAEEEMTQELEQKVIKEWKMWVQKYADSILDGGAPLGTTKKTDKSGVSDTQNAITSYTIVQAESHQEAAEMFTTNPHITLFPNNSVEIMEFLSIPGME